MLQLFQTALATARQRMTELRQSNWETFVNGLNSHTPLSRAWRDINRIKGKKTSQVSHPNPPHRANELINNWATTDSFASLPPGMQAKLNSEHEPRDRLINFMMNKEHDDCNILFTEFELNIALTKGRATSPGEDGITYDIIRLLRSVPGSPLQYLHYIT